MSLVEVHNDSAEMQAITPILYIPPRMLTRNRLAPLLTMTPQLEMGLAADEDTGEVLVRISIDIDAFERATDTQLVGIAILFRGLKNECYHPKLAELLRRSLN